MCTQRFYLFILVCFLIHLFSITQVQCKRHRRSLNQHYIQQNHSHSHVPNLTPVRKKRSRPFKLQKVNSLKPNLDSTSDSYQTSKAKLNSSFKTQSINSVTLPISDSPQHLYNSSLIMFDENNNIKETVKISSDYKTCTENFVEVENIAETEVNQFTKVESSTLITDLSSTSIRADTKLTDLEENLKLTDLEENLKLLKFKRFTKNNVLIKNSEPERKTLLNLEGPNILEDSENSLDQENSIHIRVKRDKDPSLKDSYLEDLAASFPKGEYELEEEQLASNKIEDEKLFKRSSNTDSNKNSENQQNSRFEENSRMQQENLYSDLEEKPLELGKEKFNYAKIDPDSYSMENDANDYQRENIGENGSNDYLNDNQEALQNLNRDDNKFDSTLSKKDYEALNGDYFEKLNQQNFQKDASKNQQNLISDDLYSSEVLEPKQQRDLIFNRDTKSVEGEFLNSDIKNLKNAALEKASMRFPGKEVRHNALFRNRRRRRRPLKIAHRKERFKKSKKKKSKKFNKSHKNKRGRKSRKNLKGLWKHSKMQENLAQLDKVVDDDAQIESNVEKIVFEKLRSSNLSPTDENFETISSENNEDENKKLIVGDRSKRDVKNLQKFSLAKDLNKSLNNKKNEFNKCIGPIYHEKHKLKGTLKTETLNQKDASSVQEIKTLVGKLVAKVNDLGDFVGISENKRGKKESISKFTSKEVLKIKKKADSNPLVQWSPKKIKERKRVRRKRKSHRKWGTWTDWSSCSVTCGKGRQIRWRHCIRDCHVAETEMEEKTCLLPACPPGKFLGIF